jgi:hypothetical protein
MVAHRLPNGPIGPELSHNEGHMHPDPQMKLFRQIPIWKRLDPKNAVRFNCIEDIEMNRFTVQSADFFSIPIKGEHISYLEKLFPERFIEADWGQRKWFASIEGAIADHESEFRAGS